MNVLVTGGAGYIGSHAVKQLSEGTASPCRKACLSRNWTSR
jgi:UDP-glucose 4-epimerase